MILRYLNVFVGIVGLALDDNFRKWFVRGVGDGGRREVSIKFKVRVGVFFLEVAEGT